MFGLGLILVVVGIVLVISAALRRCRWRASLKKQLLGETGAERAVQAAAMESSLLGTGLLPGAYLGALGYVIEIAGVLLLVLAFFRWLFP